jgi:hypothetical protein
VKALSKAKKEAKPPASPANEDARVTILIGALLADPQLASIATAFKEGEEAGGKRRFGSNGLKVNGKLFALFTQGTLVVKLPKVRVAALTDEGVGEPFDPGHGRLMKEWLAVRSHDASWIDLTKEAHAFVRGARR